MCATFCRHSLYSGMKRLRQYLASKNMVCTDIMVVAPEDIDLYLFNVDSF